MTQLNLSKRIVAAFTAHGITSIDQLYEIGSSGLGAVKGFGRKSLKELNEELKRIGREPIPHWGRNCSGLVKWPPPQ